MGFNKDTYLIAVRDGKGLTETEEIFDKAKGNKLNKIGLEGLTSR